jgi:hypothetical protein
LTSDVEEEIIEDKVEDRFKGRDCGGLWENVMRIEGKNEI